MRGPTLDHAGVLVVDKPAGPSSHAVVLAARRRGLARRVGHAGTLDPFATGVLPLLLGSATRLSRFLTGSAKTYEATVRFGTETTTGDPLGEHGPAAAPPDEAALRAALTGFTGRITQQPPAFSAKSVDGVRSYKRARAGAPVAPPPVEVEIHELELCAWEPPDARIRVRCAAGTYIRALARDLGRACGSAAHCAALRRPAAGAFGLDAAVSLEALDAAPVAELVARLVPLDALLPDLPAVRITERGRTALRHGRLVPAREFSPPVPPDAGEWIRLLTEDGRLVALGTPAVRFGRPDQMHAGLVLAP